MRRIDHPTRTSSLGLVTPQPYTSATPGYFDPGDPATGKQATRVTARCLNGVQETIAHPIEAAGMRLLSESDPDPEEWDHLTRAIALHAWDMPARLVVGDADLGADDYGHLIEIDASSGAATATLPAADAMPPTGRMLVAIGKSDASEHSVTITVAGNGEIDNADAFVLERQNQRVILRGGIDGENTRWQTIATANADASETVPPATTETAGIARYATEEEAAEGTIDDAVLTPAAAGRAAYAAAALPHTAHRHPRRRDDLDDRPRCGARRRGPRGPAPRSAHHQVDRPELRRREWRPRRRRGRRRHLVLRLADRRWGQHRCSGLQILHRAGHARRLDPETPGQGCFNQR